MSVEKIIVGGLDFLHVTELDIKQQVNEHGEAYIKGFLKEEEVEQCRAVALSDSALVIQIKEKKGVMKTVFAGLTYSMELKNTNHYWVLELKLVGPTYEMDLEKQIRVFQQLGDSYNALFGFLDSCSSSTSMHKLLPGMDEVTNKMIVQYQETDWQFAKRLASMLHTVLIPYYEYPKACYYIGIPSVKGGTVDKLVYKEKSQIMRYKNKKKNGLDGASAEDEKEYSFVSNEFFPLCAQMCFNGKTVFNYAIHTKLRCSNIEHTYIAKSKNGFKVPEIINKNIIGASIMGSVTGVQNDKVKVKMEADGRQSAGKLFLYSTVYSSNDHAAWYCMPETGDEVRVFFTEAKENATYAISSVHLHYGNKNPNVRFIRNPQKKEIEFTSSTLKITNNEGLEILLDDAEGITIESNKAINMNATEGIYLTSKEDEVQITGKEGIKLLQNNSSIVVKDGVDIKSQQIHLQNN